ncbi:Pyrazinamidase/nicotinamidase [Symbiodinium microadriaticum]|uniref:nicotinamidase n=1 Tax=Symbiodinium microadriaticum TaxID=2951 RepID=A0A1Q9F5T6_SYMMI|nr:Pyrazinamidase/nicotinamidase [Symbiodinium microadriaticum]
MGRPPMTGRILLPDGALSQEWLQLAGDKVAPVSVPSLGKDDALIVIDMQADFVPKDASSNPNGGRFGVAEGANVIPLISSLVDSAVNVGATICATRDYHPHDHCSFFTAGGPFPPHCLQGSQGSEFHPRIGAKLTQALRQVGPEQMLVAFKAFHEHIDSFGAFPYHDGGDGRLTKGAGCDHPLGKTLGCAKAPFTGSVILKQSDLLVDGAVNINAPPDVLSVLEDGVDRKMRTLYDAVKDKKRLFVCGLALDFCVMDTCLNALGSGVQEVYMVLDAARAAHIPGVGSFGSGFLSNPSEVVSKLNGAGVRVVDTASLAGVSTGPSW